MDLFVTPPGSAETPLGPASAGVPIRYVAAATGRHTLRVEASAGSGAYTLATTPDHSGASTKVVVSLVAKDGAKQDIVFDAIPGASLTVKAKAKKELKSKGLALELRTPSSILIDTSMTTSPLGAKGRQLSDLWLDDSGAHTLTVSGIKSKGSKGRPARVTVRLELPVGDDARAID